jgi:hypothetical protein
VIVDVPALTPVTVPVMVLTVATAVADEVHTPPEVVLVNVVVEPTHALVVPPIEARTGKAFTVTVAWSVFTHPFESVPVTVYVVVVDGLAVTLAVFVALNPVDGLHTYVDAPLAVKVVLKPSQIIASEPALTLGNWLTVTEVTALVEEHPFAVTVTLNDVVLTGVTVINDVVAPLLHK